MRMILGASLLLAVAAAASLMTGPVGWSDLDHQLLLLRLVRLLAGILAGAALAVAGVLMQGLFRNPLASPSVTGVSAGAALGVELALMGSVLMPGLLTILPAACLRPAAGCAGAALALGCLLAVARRRGDITSVVLLGMVLSMLFSALGAYLLSLANDRWELGRILVTFTLGGIDTATGRSVAVATPLVAVALGASWCWGRTLDVALSGEREAASLGVDTVAMMRWALVWTAVLAAAAVTLGGGIGFVGLIVPNVLRAYLGPGHRQLIVACALGGAAFLTAADVCARVLHPGPGEIPLGAITSLVGAPFFIWFFTRERAAGRL